MGLTIVALGTSAPELTISVMSAIDGNPGMAIGNVVGSNTYLGGVEIHLTGV